MGQQWREILSYYGLFREGCIFQDPLLIASEKMRREQSHSTSECPNRSIQSLPTPIEAVHADIRIVVLPSFEGIETDHNTVFIIRYTFIKSAYRKFRSVQYYRAELFSEKFHFGIGTPMAFIQFPTNLLLGHRRYYHGWNLSICLIQIYRKNLREKYQSDKLKDTGIEYLTLTGTLSHFPGIQAGAVPITRTTTLSKKSHFSCSRYFPNMPSIGLLPGLGSCAKADDAKVCIMLSQYDINARADELFPTVFLSSAKGLTEPSSVRWAVAAPRRAAEPGISPS